MTDASGLALLLTYVKMTGVASSDRSKRLVVPVEMGNEYARRLEKTLSLELEPWTLAKIQWTYRRFVGQVTLRTLQIVGTSSFGYFASVYTLARPLMKRSERISRMRRPEKDRIAKEVLDLWVSFQMSLSNKRKYPAAEFTAFANSARRYVQAVSGDPLIHREVVSAINGLVNFLTVERRRVPDAVIYEASRLESLFFSGYDPHFDGDEPPGL